MAISTGVIFLVDEVHPTTTVAETQEENKSNHNEWTQWYVFLKLDNKCLE